VPGKDPGPPQPAGADAAGGVDEDELAANRDDATVRLREEDPPQDAAGPRRRNRLPILDGAPGNPATKDMKQEERDSVREVLIDRKRQLSGWIERLTSDANADSPEPSGEGSSVPTHLADLDTDTFEQEKDLGMAEKTVEEVHEIDEALARIESGTYGICERCGRPIPVDRLRARPWVIRCSDCPSERESS
jgi:RNA polymerase-binding transcription factor DksA